VSSTTDNNSNNKPKEEVVLPSSSPTDQIILPAPEQQQQQNQDQQTQEEINKAIQNQQDSPLLKQIKDTMLEVSQAHMNDIVNDLKEGRLRLEYVDKSGKMQVDRRSYNPMTIGMSKKATKVDKRIRLLKADIQGMGEDGGMDVSSIQKKYPDILDEDIDEYDIKNETALTEILLNYIYSQKANIYWGINNIDNYSLHDIMIVSSLYESRNNFAPSLQSMQAPRQATTVNK
jgi:hypothetical protein